MKVFLIIMLVTLLSLENAYALSENSILGTWINQQGNGLIEISTKDNKYLGILKGSTNNQHRNDIHNPDPKLRNRPLLGVQVLGGLSYQSDNEWKNGWIYDPDNGKTFDCNVTLTHIDTLKIRVFKGNPMFGKTVIWKRKN